MHYIDTHTHLYSSQFDEDRDNVIQNSLKKGVQRFLLPNIDLSSIDGMMNLVEKYPNNCFPMMGLHPCSVTENVEETLCQIESFFTVNHKFIAVGEIGIDLYWDKTFLKEQIKAFEIQINWAKKYNLPIVIHARDSFDEIFEVLDRLNDDQLKGVFHCFTGDLEQANKVLSYGGFRLGIGGVVTFKKSGLDEVLKNISLEHLILETDSPYLAPTPYRGKRNESTFIPLIAEKLSSIYGISEDEIGNITTQNALNLFNLS
jgi:TatD DNase family protein